MRRIIRISLATAAVLVGLGVAKAGDTVLIVNKATTVPALSRQDVENIFLGKKARWDGGGVIKLAFVSGSDSEFLKRVVGKSPDQLSNLWKKLVFTGQGTMPKVFQTEEELVQYVAATPGACGYASSGKNTAQVHELPVP